MCFQVLPDPLVITCFVDIGTASVFCWKEVCQKVNLCVDVCGVCGCVCVGGASCVSGGDLRVGLCVSEVDVYVASWLSCRSRKACPPNVFCLKG